MITSITKTVAIWGAGNRGKTSIIIKIYHKLLNLQDCTLIYKSEKPNQMDFICIFRYGEKHIAFNSAGDNNWEVEDGINSINKEAKNRNINIDYYICATRTRGESVSSLENIINSKNLFYFDSRLSINTNFENKIWLDKYSEFQSERIYDFLIKII